MWIRRIWMGIHGFFVDLWTQFWPELKKDWAKPPNFVTYARLIGSPFPFLFLLFWGVVGSHYMAAMVVFICVAATDKLDGYMARKWGWVTWLGTFLDASVDKIFIVTTLIAQSIVNPLMWIVTAIIASREIYVFLFLRRAKNRGQNVAVIESGKVKMVVQCFAIGFKMLPLTGYWRDVQWAFIGCMVTLTVTSGLDYFRAFRDAKRIEK